MSVLLVQMPFFTVDSPSISLSLLQASLTRAGIACDVEYLNLEFAEELGLDLYSWIAGDAPPYLLFGDLIFTPALHGHEVSQERLDELVQPLGTPGVPQVPTELFDAYPELVEVATRFVDRVADRISWNDYDLVGFATMFQIAPALALSKRIASDPSCPPLILGGSYCESDMGEQLLQSFPWIDYVARGESENLIVELAQQLAGSGPGIQAIEGLVWRDDEQVRCNGQTGRLAPPRSAQLELPTRRRQRPDGTPKTVAYELDLLPTPDYSAWIDSALATHLVEREELRLPVETSRGCWWGERHHCTFCGLNGGTIAYRRKSPERALEDFKALTRYNVNLVHAVDDIIDFKYFNTLLPELKELDHGFEIFYEVKANMTFERVEALRDAGIVWIQPGIESLSSPLLELMDKGIESWRNVRLLRHTAQLEMGVAWNLLYGFPDEDPQWFSDMVPLTAVMSHLQPPYIECCQVRIHRFSPLFRGRGENGLVNVVPTASYYEIFPFPDEVVARLAYYFEHAYSDGRDPNVYIQSLADGVKGWHNEVGTAAFLSVDRAGTLTLLDTRRIAKTDRALLADADRRVYLECGEAATFEQLIERAGIGDRELRSILDRFLESGWIVELDDRYLALAVPVDHYVPSFVPVALVEQSLIDGYCARMARTHQGFVEAVPSLDRLRSGLTPVPG